MRNVHVPLWLLGVLYLSSALVVNALHQSAVDGHHNARLKRNVAEENGTDVADDAPRIQGTIFESETPTPPSNSDAPDRAENVDIKGTTIIKVTDSRAETREGAGTTDILYHNEEHHTTGAAVNPEEPKDTEMVSAGDTNTGATPPSGTESNTHGAHSMHINSNTPTRDPGLKMSTEDPSVYQDAELRLVADLEKNFTKARPVIDWRKTVNVRVELALYKIIEIDSPRQVMSTRGQLICTWYDERLVWNPQDYGHIDTVVLPAQSVWLPDIGITNSIGKVLEKDWWENNVVDVLSSGFVVWAPGDRIDTSCELQLTYFPYDTQLCMIVIGTVSSTSAKVNLESTSGYIDLHYFQRNGEWIVVGNKTESVQVPLLATTGKDMLFPRVVFKLLLRRRSGYYFINIVIPCVVLSLLSALVFKVPVESGEKISLSITVLLSFSVFLLVIASGIPKISTTVSLFAVYLTFLMLLNALALFFTAFVLRQHHKFPMKQVPHWLRLVVLDCLGAMYGEPSERAKYVLTKAPSSDKGERERQIFRKFTERNNNHTAVSIEGPQSGSRSDRNRRNEGRSEEHVALQRVKKSTSTRTGETTPSVRSIDDVRARDRRNKSSDRYSIPETTIVVQDTPQLSKLQDTVQDVLMEIRRARADLATVDSDQEMWQQWKAVSRILDSFFFTVYLIIILPGSFLLLIILPLIERDIPELSAPDLTVF